jgi:hypothetical protein
MKRLYLSLKGFGDLVILADSLKRASVMPEVEIIVSKRLREMADILLPVNCSINSFHNPNSPLPIYDLRNQKLDFFSEIIDLRQAVKKKLKSDSYLVLDLFSYRNEFIFASIPHRYLPKSSNIYTSYALEFGIQSDNNREPKLIRKQTNCLVFPFGSSLDRSLSGQTISDLVDFFKKKNIPLKIACHQSHRYRIEKSEFEYIFFQSASELIDLVRDAGLLVSVDTVAIHLARYFGIPIFLVSDAWSHFIPPSVIELGRVYRQFNLSKLYSDLECYLNSL